MWIKTTWVEAKEKKLFIYSCCAPDATWHTTFASKPNQVLSQTCCGNPELNHTHCVAWVEEVTLPRVVVEWTEKDITYRLVQTTGSKIAVERLAYKEDLMGLKHLYWEFWTNPASGMGSGLIAALVEKLDGVGQK